MRLLLRFLLARPVLLFSVCAIAAVAAAIVAFVLSERRARAMAELAEDGASIASQRLRLAIISLVTIGLLGFVGWWLFVRVHTEPNRALIVVRLEPSEGTTPLHWWDGQPGPKVVAEGLAEQLGELGIDVVPIDHEHAELLAGTLDPADIQAHARALEARWIVELSVRVDKTIALQGADFSDYVLEIEAAVTDSETGERFAAADMPMRAFLWGETPNEALMLNASYVVQRATMPLVVVLAEREPIAALAEGRSGSNTERALAIELEPLFSRSQNLAEGLAKRDKERASAREREPEDRGTADRHLLGDVLAEEYFIGTAADGRLILLTDPKHVSVVPDRLGYVLTNEGEAIVLSDADGGQRELLFEHYNVYSAPAVSADGRVLWMTLANHGASKSLVSVSVPEGEMIPVLTHPTEYDTSPLPSPDGSRAVFYSRPSRYAASTIDMIDRAGKKRDRLVEAEQAAGRPVWTPEGDALYVPIGDWERIVEIDASTLARTHVLGRPPEGEPLPELPSPPAPADAGDVPLAEDPSAPPPPDPRTTSRFSAIALGHDGRTLYAIEEAIDGTPWIGAYSLDNRQYTRLAQLDARWLAASPTEARLAVQVRGFTSTDDPRPGDDEILLLGPQPGEVQALTLNSEEDELSGWSRDGKSVFAIQRSRDPGSEELPVVRAYRYTPR